jgi:Cytochrome P450
LAEIDAMNDGGEVTDTDAYTYLDWTIKEFMRMQTVTPLITRESSNATHLTVGEETYAVPAF